MRPSVLLKTGLAFLASTILLEVGFLSMMGPRETKLSGAIIIMTTFPLAFLLIVVGLGLVVSSGCVAVCHMIQKSGRNSIKGPLDS